MPRSARAVFAVLVLPGFLVAQQAPASHTVVDGDTLWDLANRYYADPFDWRRIYTANQDRIEDPNLILPGQVLTIPGVDAEPAPVTDVAIEEAAPLPPPGPAPRAEPEHTIFYTPASSLVGSSGGGGAVGVLVSQDQVYSAPWLIALETRPDHVGVLTGFAAGSGRSETPRSFDRVTLRPRAGTTFRVGDELRTYRITRTVEDVGEVVRPTGVVTVTDVNADGAVGVVVKEYDRVALNDYLGPLPPYALSADRMPEPVTGGSQAMVMGFASFAELQDLGAIAFLDLGADEGVAVGDEFEYLNTAAGEHVVEGVLQVVGVTPSTASARIVDLDDAVFEQGVVVRLSRKMR